MKPKVLTIAGSDSSGGAGIQGDLKTIHSFGAYGLCAVTAVTAQNSKGVSGVWPIDGEAIYSQIMNLFEDIKIDAVKIGMLGNLCVLKGVVRALEEIKSSPEGLPPVVLDPVLVSSSGYNLLEPEGIEFFIKKLIPLSTVITPNLPEAQLLSGELMDYSDSVKKGIESIFNLGCANVILKGGHREGKLAEDLLYDGDTFKSFSEERILSKEVHGTGCIFSSAVAANLAIGRSLEESVSAAKKHITEVIYHSEQISREPENRVCYGVFPF